MALFTLGAFCVALIGCIFLKFSIIYALLIGFCIFCAYGLWAGHSLGALMKMALSGILTVKVILITFILIGIMTALWRASGTIPIIIYYSSKLVQPSIFILIVFLLNTLVSMLMGTAFGTAATMGVISMAIANTMGINPAFIGGAVVAGAFFGDRCSPVSTSALLVSTLTYSNIFDNIKLMLRTAAIPFILTCIAYYLLGYFGGVGDGTHAMGIDIKGLFSASFNLHWVALLPAIAILILSLFRVKVRVSMSVSIIIAIFVCIFLQDIKINTLPKLMFFGFYANDAELAKMLNGGGIISMVRTMAIVCISSSYAGIFKGVSLLSSIKGIVNTLGQKATPFGGLICSSIFTSMIACNQTLAILLTHQLYDNNDTQEFAIDLENSVVVISALIPWSIASAVPLVTIGAPETSLIFAFFLYILPIYTFIMKLAMKKAKL